MYLIIILMIQASQYTIRRIDSEGELGHSYHIMVIAPLYSNPSGTTLPTSQSISHTLKSGGKTV